MGLGFAHGSAWNYFHQIAYPGLAVLVMDGQLCPMTNVLTVTRMPDKIVQMDKHSLLAANRPNLAYLRAMHFRDGLVGFYFTSHGTSFHSTASYYLLPVKSPQISRIEKGFHGFFLIKK